MCVCGGVGGCYSEEGVYGVGLGKDEIKNEKKFLCKNVLKVHVLKILVINTQKGSFASEFILKINKIKYFLFIFKNSKIFYLIVCLLLIYEFCTYKGLPASV